MSGDDPPYLPVGTDVSAKYKGAFCEAKVSKVVRVLSLKVTYIGAGLGTGTVTDEQIRIPGPANQPPGAALLPLRVGQTIQVKHPEKREFVNATINRIRDCSQYTVVFDDGDITTLRRTALCLKSGRHFNESETLDQLPLTHPEHFGNPVVGGRRGRRSRQLKEDSSDDDDLDDMEMDRNSLNTNAANMGRDVGKVVCVETSEGKRKTGRDSNWFPGLVVAPTAQAAVRINTREECLIRSFRDGRYYTVPRKEITEFKRDGATSRVDSPPLAEAVDKALNYLDTAELPQHWDRDTLFGLLAVDYDSDENYSDSSDDEPREEKDHFVAQLYKFMDDRGTPLNKGPIICNRDVDLYRFFRNVEKLGGFNSVTNKNRWRAITARLGFTKNSATTLNLVKQAYSRFLLPFEEFNRKLGCTMVSHPRGARKNRGRALIRDKDRSTPVQASPKPEIKTEDSDTMSEKEKKDEDLKKRTRKEEIKKEPEDSSSSDENIEIVKKIIETPSTSKVVKKTDKVVKRVKPIVGEKVRALVEKFEEKEDDDKVQQTRSKATTRKDSTASSPDRKVRPDSKNSTSSSKPRINRPQEDEKKKKIPKKKDDEKLSDSSSSDPAVIPNVNIGDKLKVYYGPNFDSKVTYEAKVLETEKDDSGTIYLVHYTGWNNRYDEWIKPHRIAENITQTSKGKRPAKSAKNLNNSAPASTSSSAAKRGRGPSVSSRNTSQETGPPSQPRSTTPSSITSSSSRTKSPATPAVRAPSARLAKQAETVVKRCTSVTPQAQQSSTASDSDSGSSDTEEIPKRKPMKRKEETPERNLDEDGPTERPKRIRKTPKKHSDSVMTLSSNSNSSTSSIKVEPLEPKGSTVSTFDLNKIRSELKGFEKALKIAPIVPVEEIEPSPPAEAKILLNKITTEEIKKREKTPEKEEVEVKKEATDDIYEFKEPEPLELETRGSKLTEEKTIKKRRLLEDLDKPPESKISPMKKKLPVRTPPKIIDDKKSKYRRTFSRKSDDSESSSSSPRSKSPSKLDNLSQSIENVAKPRYASEDAFDKLVVSPSFNLKASPKSTPEEDEDEKSSDEEPIKTEPVEDIKIEEVVSEGEEEEASSSSDSSDEDAPIHEAIRGIEESKNDEESADDLLDDQCLFGLKKELKMVPENVSTTPLIPKPKEPLFTPTIPEKLPPVPEKVVEKPPVRVKTPEPVKAKSPEPLAIKIEKTVVTNVKKEEKIKISPALQETDSSLLSLLEAAINQPSPDIPSTENLYIPKRNGPRIAGSILQKFDAIKKKEENPSPVKSEPVPEIESEVTLEVVKEEVVLEKKVEEAPTSPISPEFKRRPLPKKNLSREFIEFEDSDSSDSEERLVIARSDDDSQLSQPDSLGKIEDSNGSGLRINEESSQEDKPKSPESKKDLEEPDSNISLLLCEETIPGSPAPVSESANTPSAQEQTSRVKPKSAKSLVMEIPFASAPGTSKTEDVKPVSTASSMVQAVTTNVVTTSMPETKQVEDVLHAGNSGPSTPNSSISNLSPRGENGCSSPGTADEGKKSRRGSEAGDMEQPFSGLRVLKPHRYSEEDSILLAENTSLDRTKPKNSPRSINEDSQPPLPQLSSPNPNTSIVLSASITGIPSNRKRRKSFKGDDAPSHPPSGAKRGRKPNVLKNLRANIPSSTNSDSDASEDSSATSRITIPIGPGSGSNTGEIRLHSIHHSMSASSMQRTSKYNFMVEFDSGMDATQRIALLQQRISDIRKAYSHEKNDLASIERRLKKIRRREREAMKAAKQEVACS